MSNDGATALLLIDLQRAARNCARLVALARARDIPVIWTRMQFRSDYSDGGLLTETIRPNLRRIGALRVGTPDVDLLDGLGRAANDMVIEKQRYSALVATNLEEVLRAGRIDRVIVGGVTTAMCVESTVRDLGQRDWHVVVVPEACAEFEPEHHAAALRSMAFGFAQLADLESL
jgi:nicotinamidase-related amidase